LSDCTAALGDCTATLNDDWPAWDDCNPGFDGGSAVMARVLGVIFFKETDMPGNTYYIPSKDQEFDGHFKFLSSL
jgi:hypothetical protein